MSRFAEPHAPARGRAKPAWLRALALLLVLAASPCGALRAAEAEAAAPPARIGQLSFLIGTVQMQLEPGGAWQPAELNTPLGAGTALANEAASRLEVRIGSAALRAGVQAQFSLPVLDNSGVHAELARGSLTLRLRALAAGEQWALSAEGGQLQPLQPGAYRADFAPRLHRLVLHVQEGQARVTVAQHSWLLQANQRAVIDTLQQQVIEEAATDERSRLDDFSDQRDRRSERSNAARQLPAEMTGAEALDGHGSWRNEPGHGTVWYPDNLPPDWAPYRTGRWRWLPTWGWTWIDEAPWGFAPFHYGRWLFLGGRWAWVPGVANARAAAAVRPVYAPALVGFYGGSGADSWAMGGAPVVGWYPLAPGEVYWPPYNRQLGYVRSLNAASVPDAAQQIRALPDPAAPGPAHRFARTAFAATAVPLESFRAMQPVAPSQLPVAPAALAQAPLAALRAPPPWSPAHNPAPAAPQAAVPATATAAAVAARPPATGPAHPPPAAAAQRPRGAAGAAHGPRRPHVDRQHHPGAER
jgi:hypothetical protein